MFWDTTRDASTVRITLMKNNVIFTKKSGFRLVIVEVIEQRANNIGPYNNKGRSIRGIKNGPWTPLKSCICCTSIVTVQENLHETSILSREPACLA
jgi:hypothetical protein